MEIVQFVPGEPGPNTSVIVLQLGYVQLAGLLIAESNTRFVTVQVMLPGETPAREPKPLKAVPARLPFVRFAAAQKPPRMAEKQDELRAVACMVPEASMLAANESRGASREDKTCGQSHNVPNP